MKSYKDMTYRYLKGQRSRSLLTILGIILSVAMVSAIGSLLVSAQAAVLRDAIRDNGSYHGILGNMDLEKIKKLEHHIDVEEVAISQDQGYGIVVETSEEERRNYQINSPYRYIDIKAYDDRAKELLPINLKEGRLPKSSDEIIIEDWMSNYFDEKVGLGDKIKLSLGQRDVRYGKDADGYETYEGESFRQTGEGQYTVVGFIEPRYVSKSNFITRGIIGLDSNLSDNTPYTAYFSLNNIKNANEKISSIGENMGLDEEDISTNNRVLRLYAESINQTFNSSIMAIVAFIVILIVVSTVAVIYNSFNISVIERISQFGLLRSIGASPRQIRGLVLKEAAILSAISIPIGLLSGVLAMKVVFYIIGLISGGTNLVRDMRIIFSPTVFIVGGIVGLITVFLSAIGPARQAAKVSPLEAIRNTGEFKKEDLKKVKSSRLTRKILGVEGEIAHKNLRRNRKRFLITVFSMVLSIALFITFSTFSDFMFKIGSMAGYEERADFEIYGNVDEVSIDEIAKALGEMEDVDRVYNIRETNGSVNLSKEQISRELLEKQAYLLDKEKDGLITIENVEFMAIGDENLDELKGLLKSGSIDIEKLNKENGVLVVNNVYAMKSNGARSLVEGFKLKVGDQFPLTLYSHDMDSETDGKDVDLRVMGILEKGILGEPYNYNSSLKIITTEEVWERVYKKDSSNQEQFYANLNIVMAKEGSREDIVKYLEEVEENTPGFRYVDMVESAKEIKQATIIMSIFLYGFVSLIALISTINIINTISTNIILRTKEISMIKAVGMGQWGIKKMVAMESIFYGWYASIFGGTIGLGLTYILFRLVGGISEFEYKLPWLNVLVACAGAIIISLIAGAYPLKRINDNIIVENMRTDN